MNRKDLDFKKRWLQWVLDFIQMDLESLSKTKRKKLAEEIVYFCSNESSFMDWEDWEYNVSSPPEERGNLMNKYLNEMEEDPSNIQKKLKSFVEKIEDMVKRPTEEPDYNLPETSTLLFIGWLPEDDGSSFIPDFNKDQGNFLIESYPKSYTLEDWAILNLSKLIDGIEIHSIMKCKGCGRYFLNVTRKKKIYCNFSCASRSIAHKRYEELRKDPKKYEAHLKKYRKYSRERYDKLRKDQIGPNVKIRRRIRITQK